MKINFRQSGSFTGLTKFLEIDSDEITNQEAKSLKSLVDQSRFFNIEEPAHRVRRKGNDNSHTDRFPKTSPDGLSRLGSAADGDDRGRASGGAGGRGGLVGGRQAGRLDFGRLD